MTDSFTPTLRALVVVTLLLATATLMLVAVNAARAAGALAAGSRRANGAVYDFRSVEEVRKGALAECQIATCRVVAVTNKNSSNECVIRAIFRDAKG
jgi:hypothetical protein